MEINHKNVIVNCKCPCCGLTHKFKLKDYPGTVCWVCDECSILENFPEVVSVTIQE